MRRRGILALAALALTLPLGAGQTAPSQGAAPPKEPPAARVDRLLAHMSLAQKVGQMVMFSFDGTVAGPAVLRMVRDWGVGGLIFYRPNVASAAGVRAFTGAVQRAARIPLLISTDEEGGSIAMVPFAVGVHPLLSPHDYGALNSPARVYADTFNAGRDLRALGINMDLAPVVDVLINPGSPIGARSFGADAHVDARLATAAIKGYQDAGIAATAKHFLGLGGVVLDAHQGLPTITRSMPQLQAVELVPFKAAIAQGVDALMVTHAIIPAIDPANSASLSRKVISGFIRGTLGYRGLIISDSLEMGAIDTRLGMAEASVEAAAAGSDIVLISYYTPLPPATFKGALDAVIQAVRTGRIGAAQIDDAARHVLLLKAKLGLL